jgi:hypothetical protein
MNLYTYPENPVTYFDPHGLFECRDRCFWFGRNAGDWQIIYEEIGTWLSSAHSFWYFYETMRRQRMKRTYRNRYLCFKFSADCNSGCRYREFEWRFSEEIEQQRWTAWETIAQFTREPTNVRVVPPSGIQVSCPPAGPNWRGGIQSFFP